MMRFRFTLGFLLVSLLISASLVTPSQAGTPPTQPSTQTFGSATGLGPAQSSATIPLAQAGVCPHEPQGGGPADTLRMVDTGNDRIQAYNIGREKFGDPASEVSVDNSTSLTLSQPQGIASGPRELTFIADSGNDRVIAISRGLNYKDHFGSTGSASGEFDNPTGLAISSDSHLYVVDTGNDRVQKFTNNGIYRRQWGSMGSGQGEFNGALDVAVDWMDGSVYVADTGNDRVQKFDDQGNFILEWGDTGSGNGDFDQPSGIAVHPQNGDVYVLDTGNDRVQQFDAQGAYIRKWGSTGSGPGEFFAPRGIAVSPRHGVFVMDTGNHRFQLFNFNGDFKEQWGTPGTAKGEFSNPVGIATNMRGVDLDQCYVHDFSLNGEPRRVTVFYTTQNGLPRNWVDDDVDSGGNNIVARDIAKRTAEAWETFFDYGLGEPRNVHKNADLGGGKTGHEQEVWAYELNVLGWCCGSARYHIDARHASTGDWRKVFETIIHEMFHNVQPGKFFASPKEPLWVTEGGARNSQDKVSADIDEWDGSSYMGEINNYMMTNHKKDLRTFKYASGPFWTYFQEQLADGTEPDPGYGMESIEHYFDVVDPLYGMDAVAQAVADLDDDSRNLEEFWTDFTIANYVKNFGGVPEEYNYHDAVNNPYPDVTEEFASLFSSFSSSTFTPTLKPFSSRYYRFRPSFSNCRYAAFEMSSDKRVAFTLADHRDGILLRPPETHFGKSAAVTLHPTDYYGGPDGMSVILTGLSEEADVTLTGSCIDPTLEILTPKNGQPGFAGPHDDPGTVVVYVSVSAGGYGPVRGLHSSQFEVTIGGEEATVIDDAEVEDIYVLIVQAPEQTAKGDYDLDVFLDNFITDSESGAVRYTGLINDNMLVIDKSGSMADDGKLGTAQDAAQLQITDMDRNAWAGLVSFDTTASLDFGLTDITVEPARGNLRTAVNALTTGNFTAIVAGVDQALDEVEANGGADHSCNLTLLTDGMDNQSTTTQKANLINRLQNTPCPVYAIALGPDADKLLLQDLVDASGGQLYVATLPPPGSLSLEAAAASQLTSSGYLSADWRHRLIGFYDEIATRQIGWERVFVGASPDFSFETITETLPIDSSVTEVLIVVQNELGLPAGMITDPDGVVVDESYPGVTLHDRTDHLVARVQNPLPGTWSVAMDYVSTGYLVAASADTPIGLKVFARPPEEVPGTGDRVPILAIFHDDQGTIPGAVVEVDVQSSEDTITHMQLFDDGQHGDGLPGDGVYGNWFTKLNSAPCHSDTETGGGTLCDNAYQIYALATLDDIRREGQTAFAIQKSSDTDGDGMPDDWETDHGLDPDDPLDAFGDEDNDELSNEAEFEYGTDPHNPDSDGGGEVDGSEFWNGTDPLNPGDDSISPTYEIQVNPGDGGVGVSYSRTPDVFYHQIFRRPWPVQAEAGWDTVIDYESTGTYTDTLVENGQTYQYKVVPIGYDGEGRPLFSTPVTPSLDTDPPEGWIRINAGQESTTSLDVTLELGFEEDVVEMRVSNHPDFSNAAWEPAVYTKEWVLDPNTQPGTYAWVYVEYKDAFGNLSADELNMADSILLNFHQIMLPLVVR